MARTISREEMTYLVERFEQAMARWNNSPGVVGGIAPHYVRPETWLPSRDHNDQPYKKRTHPFPTRAQMLQAEREFGITPAGPLECTRYN